GRFRLDAGRSPRRQLRRRRGAGDRHGVQAAQHHLGSHRQHPGSGDGHFPDERLPHRQPQEDQGDHRARRYGHRFDQVGVKPGEIPVVGWGNSSSTTAEVMEGYVNAAEWQDPLATSYLALSLANMAASGIPPGFDIHVGTLYEKDKAPLFDKIMSSNK